MKWNPWLKIKQYGVLSPFITHYTYTVLKVLEYIERHLFMQPPRTLSSHGRSLYYSVRKTEMVAKNNGSRWAHLFPRANIGNAIAFSFFSLLALLS